MVDYLKSMMDKTKPKPKEKGDLKTSQDPPGTRKMMAGDEYAELLKNGCTEGMRNDSATKLTGHLLANSAFLWTRGFIPRVQTVLGLETPNPLSVEICKGESNIKTVCEDVLALTKLNYNSCIYCDGKPVTLRFADMIGDVLTAGPKEDFEEVLPFKHYI